ncbi:MAG: carboxypeptidase-like regulatory domain-containing protein, partial [Candidatus Poribacteria bacterium]|nr:carboxypeptidase-like regulatory domain-containing protein [Candidatus Poribacteria bacterium]
MNHLSFTRITYLFGVVIVLSLIASVPCIAQNGTTLSGTVVDTEGKPIAGFAIGLLQGSLISITDEKGAFTFTNIPAGPVQIAIPAQPSKENVKPIFNFEADDELVSIKIKGITLYQDMRPPFGGITFGVKSGSHIEDITVTVRPRVRIRAK